MVDHGIFKGTTNPSSDLVDLFVKWDKSNSAMKRNICFNRAKLWITRLLKREDQAPLATKLRHEDIQNALDHMFHVCFESGMSPKNYLDFCIATAHTDVKKDNLSETTKNTYDEAHEISEDAKGENDGTTPLHEAGSSGNPSGTESINSQPERSKTGKICKFTWKGEKCNINQCTFVHIDPCKDRECMALDGGLPLYKSRNCQKWHVRPKNSKKPKNPVVNGTSNNSDKKSFRSKTTAKNVQNVKGSYGRTPIQYAGKNGNFTKVQQPSKNPAAAEIRRANGMTPLHYAAKNGNPPRPNYHTNPRISFQPNDVETPYSSTVKGQFKGQQIPALGNGPAAAVYQPLTRGGNPNQNRNWGQSMDQNQVQMIAEIVMQVMKRSQ